MKLVCEIKCPKPKGKSNMFNNHSLKSVWSSPAIYAMNCVSTFTGAAQTELEN